MIPETHPLRELFVELVGRHDAQEIGRRMTMSRSVEEWSQAMQDVFGELYRITRRGGWARVAFGHGWRAERATRGL